MVLPTQPILATPMATHPKHKGPHIKALRRRSAFLLENGFKVCQVETFCQRTVIINFRCPFLRLCQNPPAPPQPSPWCIDLSWATLHSKNVPVRPSGNNWPHTAFNLDARALGVPWPLQSVTLVECPTLVATGSLEEKCHHNSWEPGQGSCSSIGIFSGTKKPV